MAPFALLSGRRLAQTYELVSPLEGNVFSSPFSTSALLNERESSHAAAAVPVVISRSTQSPSNQIPELPSTTAGLIGFICFLVAGILILIGWKLFQLRQMRKETRRKALLAPFSEKGPRPLILAPSIPLSPSVRWIPAKLSPWIDPRLPPKPAPSLRKGSVSNRPESSWSFHHLSKRATLSEASSKQSTYPSSADSTKDFTQQITPPPAIFQVSTNNVVEANLPCLQVKANDEDRSKCSNGIISSSSPTTSTQSELNSSECSSVMDDCARPDYPKLVIVKRGFPINLPDELKVSEGERLRVLRDFKDGWALCQRTSRRNPEKGAVPRCCLSELRIDTATAQTGGRANSKKEDPEEG